LEVGMGMGVLRRLLKGLKGRRFLRKGLGLMGWRFWRRGELFLQGLVGCQC
jgi:hypothetical protein